MMTIKTNTNFEQILLILAIIFLPIIQFRVYIPIAGQVLSNFFCLLGIIIFIYEVIVGNEKLDKHELFFLYYLIVFFLWQCLSGVIGILEYEYYHLICLEQMDKLHNLLQSLHSFGISIRDLTAIKIWLSMQVIKVSLIRLFFTYGISFWIFHIGKNVKNDSNDSKTVDVVFSNFVFAISILYMALVSYSVLEMGYLRGNRFCTELLTMINPLLYEPQTALGWWPPLLWSNQLRSLFLEPSFFGIASTLIVPIFFYKILKSNTFFISIVSGMFISMIFMTQSRTAVLLFFIQLFLLAFYTFCLNHTYIKLTIKILFISILSFCFSAFMISGFQSSSIRSSSSLSNYMTDTSNQFTVSDYVSNNITSVIGNKRSNNARYANARAAFLTGVDYPFFGVGILSGMYVKNRFTSKDLENNEIKNIWVHNLNKEGPLKSGIPILNQFAFEMAQFGIPGLIIYLLPSLYIIFELLKRLDKNMNLEIVCISIAYIGSIVSFFSHVAFLQYYILTGIMIVLLYSKVKKDYHEFPQSKVEYTDGEAKRIFIKD